MVCTHTEDSGYGRVTGSKILGMKIVIALTMILIYVSTARCLLLNDELLKKHNSGVTGLILGCFILIPSTAADLPQLTLISVAGLLTSIGCIALLGVSLFRVRR